MVVGESKQTGHGREIKLGRNLAITSSSVWIDGREEGTSIGMATRIDVLIGARNAIFAIPCTEVTTDGSCGRDLHLHSFPCCYLLVPIVALLV